MKVKEIRRRKKKKVGGERSSSSRWWLIDSCWLTFSLRGCLNALSGLIINGSSVSSPAAAGGGEGSTQVLDALFLPPFFYILQDFYPGLIWMYIESSRRRVVWHPSPLSLFPPTPLLLIQLNELFQIGSDGGGEGREFISKSRGWRNDATRWRKSSCTTPPPKYLFPSTKRVRDDDVMLLSSSSFLLYIVISVKVKHTHTHAYSVPQASHTHTHTLFLLIRSSQSACRKNKTWGEGLDKNSDNNNNIGLAICLVLRNFQLLMITRIYKVLLGKLF